MWVRVGCEFEFLSPASTPSLWQVRARPDGTNRVVEEEWSAPTNATWYLDAYGNICDRLVLPEGRSVLRYDAIAHIASSPDPVDLSAGAANIEDLPDEAFLYLLPSRYCWPELLRDVAWELFGETPPGRERVDAVSTWVHENIRYEVGASNSGTTALDVHESRTGVCRDFTHLGITFCRALNIPARYVAGYLPDIGVESLLPMDFSSWFEAWLGDRWWTFDPRNNEPRIGRVPIAKGRDALDAAMVTTWGAAELRRMEVWADEEQRVG